MERKITVCEFKCTNKSQDRILGGSDLIFEILQDGLMKRKNGVHVRFIFDLTDEINPGDKFRLVLERIQN